MSETTVTLREGQMVVIRKNFEELHGLLDATIKLSNARLERTEKAEAELAALRAPPVASGAMRERVRHVKRGTEYEVIGEAEAQVSSGRGDGGFTAPSRVLREGDKLTVYQGSDGKLWCRFTDEFRDGRFQTVTAHEPSGGPAGGETFDTIRKWQIETFGEEFVPERIARRAAEELQELLEDPSRVEEAADVVIVLVRYPGLTEAVQQKMKVNRARTWRVMGDGTGYHVKPGGPADVTEGQS